MGKLGNGILGTVTNRVGNVVGSTWKGINTVRVYQPNVSNPKTTKQVAARTNMSNAVLVAQQMISTAIQPLWNRFSKGMSGYNAFISANIGVAFLNSVIDCSSIVFSVGKLFKPVCTGAIFNNGAISVSIGTVTNDPYALPTDELYFAVVNSAGDVPKSGKFSGNRQSIEGGEESILVGADFDLVGAYVLLAFRRADGTIVSMTENQEVE